MGTGHFLHASRRAHVASAVLLAATLVPPALQPTQAADAAAKWVSSARVSPSQILAGDSVTISASLTAPGNRTVVVNLEVQDPAGHTVGQRLWNRQSFTRGDEREYHWNGTIPLTRPAGRYTVKIGVFGMA